jgi:uncharacterized protein (DUF3084 family)
LTSRTVPIPGPSVSIDISDLRYRCERPMRTVRRSGIPSPVSAETGTTPMFSRKFWTRQYMSAEKPSSESSPMSS